MTGTALDLTALVLGNVDGILIVDDEGVVRFTNPAANELLGQDATGATWGHPFSAESSVEIDVGAGNRMRTVEMRVAPIEWEGETAYLASLRDVSENRRLRAELERSNAELDTFATAAAHDLKQPLIVVHGFLAILQDMGPDELATPKAAELLAKARASTERSVRMIEALLHYSRVGNTDLQRSEVDTEACVHATVEALMRTADRDNVEVEIGDLPVVEGDEAQLGALFQNLLSNAIKYGGSHVSVTAERVGSLWRFAIADDGVGVSELERERVFRLFTRSTGVDDIEGSGVGLALCKRIVERHGGVIWIDGTVTKGTTVCFTIPA